jgi:hypothetical protein
MNYRRYKDTDYDIICSWFAALDWPLMPKESIPPYGIIIEDDDQNAFASSFIYLVDEPGCDFIYPGWVLINPDTPYKKIPPVLDSLAKAYESIARENGKTHIQTTMKTDSLINFLCEKHGYKKAEVNVTRLVKYIDKTKEKEGIFWYDQEGIDKYFPESRYVSKK